MRPDAEKVFSGLFARRPEVAVCRNEILQWFAMLCETFSSGGTLFCCGNGGSASDCEHIAGELLKSFRRHRTLPSVLTAGLQAQGEEGKRLLPMLEGALPVVPLVSFQSTLTAFANDVAWETVFAQQLCGLGRTGDCLLAISTSGNSADCVAAARVARALGMHTVALTGKAGGRLAEICDVAVRVPEEETFLVQELHLSVYHALCAMVEEEFWG